MLQEYRSELVPGLLQTPDYARAVIAARTDLSPAVVDQRVRFRMARQRAVFDRPEPARLDFAMAAGALNVVVGSPSVMQAQIAHLRAVASRDEVSVRVVPFTDGVHGAMDCPFTILDFPDPDDPALVYLESVTESRYVERPAHVQQFRDAFDRIRTVALPLEEYLRMSADNPTPWVKAAASNGTANCVEQRRNGETIEIRDTKDGGTGPTLRFTPAEFAAWLHGAKAGEFDHLL